MFRKTGIKKIFAVVTVLLQLMSPIPGSARTAEIPKILIQDVLPLAKAEDNKFEFVATDSSRGNYSLISEGNSTNATIDPDTGELDVSVADVRRFSNAKITISLKKTDDQHIEGPYAFTLLSPTTSNQTAKLILQNSKVELSAIPSFVKLPANGRLKFKVTSKERPKFEIRWGQNTPSWAKDRIAATVDSDTGLFRYKNEGNRYLSNLILAISKNGRELSRSKRFTICPNFRAQNPEFDTLGSRVRAANPNSYAYINQSANKILNLKFDSAHPERHPREVISPKKSIVADTLILGSSAPHREVFESIRQLSRNLESLEISAYNVTLKESLTLPSVSVTINAKTLTLDDGVVINTSGDNGTTIDRNGKRGGDITLNVERLKISPRQNLVFLMDGGNGERGVAGISGVDCADPPIRTALTKTEHDRRVEAAGSAVPPHIQAELYLPDALAKDTIWFEQVRHAGISPSPAPRFWPSSTQVTFPGPGTDVRRLPEASGNGGDAGQLTISQKAFDNDQILRNLRYSATGGTHSPLSVIEREAIKGKRGLPSNARRIVVRMSDPPEIISSDVTTASGLLSDYSKHVLAPTELEFTDPPGETDLRLIKYKVVRDSQPGASKQLTQSSQVWQTASAAKAHLSYLRDKFLTLNVNEQNDVLGFIKTLTEFKAECSGAHVPSGVSDLGFEVEHLLKLASSGRDIYGNPRNWAPPLTLEAAYSTISSELKSDLKLLYLCKCVEDTYANSIARTQVLSDFRNQLRQAIPQYRSEITSVRNKMDTNSTRLTAAEVSQRAVIDDIQEYQRRKQARKGSFLGKFLKGVSVIAAIGAAVVTAVTPGAQAASVGILTTIAGTASAGSQIVDQVNNGFKDGLGGIARTMASLDNIDLSFGNSMTIPSELKDGLKALQSRVDQAKEVIARTIPSREEVTKYIADLKAAAGNDPVLTAKLTKAERCYEERATVAEECDADLTKLSSTTQLLGSSLDTLEKIDLALADQSMHLTADTVQSVGVMKRSVTDRLQYYFYLMKAAFEYGRLEPYSSDFLLTDLYTYFDQVSRTPPFDANQAVNAFSDCLRAVRADVLAGASTRIHLSQPEAVQIALSSQQLNQLNNNLNNVTEANRNPLIINVRDSLLYDYTAENMRINGFSINPSDIIFRDDDITQFVKIPIQIRISHVGNSILTKGGKVFEFAPGKSLTYRTLLFDPRSPGSACAAADDSSTSSMYRFFAGTVASEIDVYSRRGAMNNLKIEVLPRSAIPSGKRVEITRLTLKMNYVYSDPSPIRCWLDVRTSKDIQTFFSISPDVYQKKSGCGNLIAQYVRGAEVVLRASPAYGKLVFTGWKDQAGLPLTEAGDPFTVKVRMDSNKVAIAGYAARND